MNSSPVLFVQYSNDDDRECGRPPLFEKTLRVTSGRIFEGLGGFETLDVLSAREGEVTLELDGKTKTLHPGEEALLTYELPGLIADGSGWEYFTARIRFLTEKEAAVTPAEDMAPADGT